MSSPFFAQPYAPTYKPGDTLQIAGKAYEVKEVRPALPFRKKYVSLTSDRSIDLKEEGLKGKAGELLQVWLRLRGPCEVLIRVEGAGGEVAGGYAGTEKHANEDTPTNMLEFFVFEDRYGWLYLVARPIVVPAWLQVEAKGFVYLVSPTTKPPVSYPPYISAPRGGA